MKLQNVVMLLFILFAFCGLKSKATNLCSVSIQLQNDSTFLLVKPNSKKSIDIYWNNFYKERPILYEIDKEKKLTILHEYPLMISVLNENKKSEWGGTSTFVIYKGETVYVTKNKQGNIEMKALGDSIRTNELDFFNSMDKQLGDFGGIASSLSSANQSNTDLINAENMLYKKRVDFLQKYQEIRPISKRFDEYLQNIFYYTKLSRLLSSYYSPYVQSEKVKLPDELIKRIFDEEFKENDDYFYLHEYRGVALKYVYYLTQKTKKANASDLYTLFKTAETKLSKNTRDVVLFDIINLASQQAHDSLLTMTNTYLGLVTNHLLEEYTIDYQRKAELLRSNLLDDSPKYILMPANDQAPVTWKDLLATTAKEQTIYVDFWASWCAPCRAEMPASMKLRDEYARKNIRFIYISTDENPSAWKRAMKQVGLPDSDSYLLVGGSKSALAQELKISSIPRYVLIDKNGKIIDADAPRPSDPKIKSIFDKKIK